VSLRVDYDERAIDQAAAFLDDPPGIRSSRPSRGDLHPATRRSRPTTDSACHVCRFRLMASPCIGLPQVRRIPASEYVALRLSLPEVVVI
jgi:hypothetical protein